MGDVLIPLEHQHYSTKRSKQVWQKSYLASCFLRGLYSSPAFVLLQTSDILTPLQR